MNKSSITIRKKSKKYYSMCCSFYLDVWNFPHYFEITSKKHYGYDANSEKYPKSKLLYYLFKSFSWYCRFYTLLKFVLLIIGYLDSLRKLYLFLDPNWDGIILLLGSYQSMFNMVRIISFIENLPPPIVLPAPAAWRQMFN